MDHSISYKKTDCFCLKRRAYGKSSAVIHLLTREFGPMSLYHKGFFSKRSPYPAILDLGQETEVVMTFREERCFLKEASLKRSFNVSDHSGLTLMSFIFELLASIPQQTHLPFHQLYQDLADTLEGMTAGKGRFNLALRFQLRLLNILGMTGDVDHCSRCHKRFSKEEWAYAEPHCWNFFCASCPSPLHTAFRLSQSQRQCITSWFHSDRISPPLPHMNRSGVVQTQKHLNSIYEELYTLQSLSEYMRLLES